MANEGIMALPQGEAVSGEQPQNQPQSVTSAQSYDAAQSALAMVNPQNQAALKEAVRQNIGDLQLTPDELDLMIQAFEYVSQNPVDYANMVKLLLEEGVVDPGDMPEEYDPEFIGSMLVVLNEMQQMQGAGAQEPMDMAPVVEGLPPMAMAQGGLADVGQYLASKGRGDDRILAHITPEEAAMLKSRGGAGTTNPITGLPEFKGNPIKKAWTAVKKVVKGVVTVAKKVLQSPVGKILGTVALATVLGPAGVGLSMGTAAGAASAGTTLLAGGSLKEALMSGAMGYVGGGGTVMGVSPVASLGQYLPGAAGGALNTGLATGAIGAGIGKLGGMSTADALKMGLISGGSAAALKGLENMNASTPSPAQQEPTFEQGGSGTRSMLTPQTNQAMGYSSATSSVAQEPGFFDKFLNPSGIEAQGIPGAEAAGNRAAEAYTSRLGSMGTAAGKEAAYQAAFKAASPSMFSQYAPIVAAGTLAAGALGGFKNKETIDPLAQAEKDRYFEANRAANERDKQVRGGGYGLEYSSFPTYNPIVTTDYSAAIPRPQGPAAPTAVPTGITGSPSGVAQPYNMAGMYGVPLVYGQSPRPQGLAKGGAPVSTKFPRKTGPINGAGTGTSDDIPAMLSDGEFVFTAKAVRNAGNGSRRKGAARMYKLMKMLEGGPVGRNK